MSDTTLYKSCGFLGFGKEKADWSYARCAGLHVKKEGMDCVYVQPKNYAKCMGENLHVNANTGECVYTPSDNQATCSGENLSIDANGACVYTPPQNQATCSGENLSIDANGACVCDAQKLSSYHAFKTLQAKFETCEKNFDLPWCNEIPEEEHITPELKSIKENTKQELINIIKPYYDEACSSLSEDKCTSNSLNCVLIDGQCSFDHSKLSLGRGILSN